MLQVFSSLYFVDETRSQGLSRPETPIAVSGKRMSSFSIKGTLQLLSSAFIDTSCTNISCDSLEMRKNGVSKTHCSCWKVEHRVCNIVLCVAFRVTCQGECNPGLSFMVKEYTSRNFTSLFVSGRIPPGLSAAMMLSDNNIRLAMRRNVRQYINIVNANGGWDLEGWIKPALQMDRGTLDSSSAGNARNNPSQQSMVQSSNFIYHITSARPADQNMEREVRRQLDALRIDVTNLRAIGRAAPANAGVVAPANPAIAGALGPANAGAEGQNLGANVGGAPNAEAPAIGGAAANGGAPEHPAVDDDLD